MAAVFENALRLSRSPAIRRAYAHWWWSKVRTGRPPLRRVAEGAVIGGWLSFSEYLSYRDGIPQREQLLARSLLDQANREAVALDVGANIGIFTCALAGMGAKSVHAFEPIPETFCRLKANVKANRHLDRCTLNCLAVGREPGLVTFRVKETSPATNKLAASGVPVGIGAGESLQQVAVATLDAYCDTAKINRISFLKIDVEGMESFVLQGARNLLRRRAADAVLIEICPGNLHAVGLSPAILYEEIMQSGYRPHVLCSDGRTGSELSLSQIEAIRLDNAVLLPA